MTITDIQDMISDRVSTSDFGHTLKFDCGEDGILVININETTTEDMDTECTVGVSLENLHAMVKGELNPTMGFMLGKLKLEGSMGVAMKLGSLL